MLNCLLVLKRLTTRSRVDRARRVLGGLSWDENIWVNLPGPPNGLALHGTCSRS